MSEIIAAIIALLVQNGGNPSGVRQSAGDRRMSIGKAWTLCG